MAKKEKEKDKQPQQEAPVEEAPGFRKIRLTPRPDARLGHASASYDSPCGLYRSAWQTVENGFAYDFTVPFGCTAELELTGVCADALTVNGVPVKTAGIDVSAVENGVKAVLSAGTYHFAPVG